MASRWIRMTGSTYTNKEEIIAMAIIYHESTKTFHLTNDKVSYILRVMENGQLENLYYGRRIHDRENFNIYHEEEARSQTSICLPEPSLLSMQYTRQEYPGYGTGDYRSPAFTVLQVNGSRIADFKFSSYEIADGKPSIAPLPATYVDDNSEAQTLTVRLTDEEMGADLFLSYTIYSSYPVVTRNARIQCHADKSGSSDGSGRDLVIERAMSMSVEFNDMDYDLITLSGAWARERYIKRRPLEMGIQSVQSLAGTCSSAEHNPFLALVRPNTDEKQGDAYGFNLVYSGNFLAQVEVSTFDMTRVMLGINPEGFSWKLSAGESFQTPEVVMVYSDEGLGGMSRAFHRLYRDRLQRGKYRNQPRPILLNNWEATYFTFDEDKLLSIAGKAKECGIELFVLDDGWFGARNDDYRGLGDWVCNLDKIPSGISGLSRKVEALGMKFGLWVELEMVNKDSDLYRAHPDWIIAAPNRFQSPARHQHVLDFSRKEVVDYIYEMISKILRESKISYIKWDMNRYMTEPYSAAAEPGHEGETMHRYILGLYDLYTRLTTEFPDILFESCASGGARFDAGMMYFAPQNWCSDDTDGYERQKIQYGTSLVYPIVSMGSHVSASPNHQLMREVPLETRGHVAYFGTFGYELDLNLLSEKDIETVKKQVAFMKAHRELIQVTGDLYRLRSPFEGNDASWMVVSPDKTEAVAVYCQRLNKVNASWLRIFFDGLDPDREYTVTYDVTPDSKFPVEILRHYDVNAMFGLTGEGKVRVTAYGDQLMSAGIPVRRRYLDFKGGDFASLLFEIKAAD